VERELDSILVVVVEVEMVEGCSILDSPVVLGRIVVQLGHTVDAFDVEGQHYNMKGSVIVGQAFQQAKSCWKGVANSMNSMMAVLASKMDQVLMLSCSPYEPSN
jgi:hypothetical protein